MKLFDISIPIEAKMPVYKNDPSRRPVLTFEKRVETEGMTSGKLEMDLHTGTHLDAPLHMVNGGISIDEISLTSVVTLCRVIALLSVEEVVTPEVLMPFDIKAGEFIVLKTHNSYEEGYNPKFVYLSEAAAVYLAGLGIKGIGMDGLGIERDQVEHPSHKVLFNSGCMILEGLRLKFIEPGDYKLIALPLKIVGAEASPVRAILIEGM